MHKYISVPRYPPALGREVTPALGRDGTPALEREGTWLCKRLTKRAWLAVYIVTRAIFPINLSPPQQMHVSNIHASQIHAYKFNVGEEFLVPMETNRHFMIPTISLSTQKGTVDYCEYGCVLPTYNIHASFEMVLSYFSEFGRGLRSTFQYHSSCILCSETAAPLYTATTINISSTNHT